MKDILTIVLGFTIQKKKYQFLKKIKEKSGLGQNVFNNITINIIWLIMLLKVVINLLMQSRKNG